MLANSRVWQVARPVALVFMFGVINACGPAPQKSADCSMALTGRVVDTAGILSQSTKVELNQSLADLEGRSSDQVVGATTNSLNGHEIEVYSLELARCWQLGNANIDNGLLILVAPNERKARIEVGRGLEDFVKNEEAGVIMETALIPNFKKGAYDTGVKAGVAAIIQELTADSASAATRFAESLVEGKPR